MTGTELKLHQIDLNVLTRIGFEQPAIYDEIGSIVGVFVNSLIPRNPDITVTVNQLRKSGALVKLNCRTKDGKTFNVLCKTANLQAALGSLVGKNIVSGPPTARIKSEITKVSIPRKRSRV